MWKILDNYYLGNRFDAINLRQLQDEGITHILNCAREMPCHYPNAFNYLKVELADPDPHYHLHIEAMCQYIDEARRKGKVLVHCLAAVSRSPSTTLAYLCHLGHPLDEAWTILNRQVRTDPHPVFLEQIAAHFRQPAEKARQ